MAMFILYWKLDEVDGLSEGHISIILQFIYVKTLKSNCTSGTIDERID